MASLVQAECFNIVQPIASKPCMLRVCLPLILAEAAPEVSLVGFFWNVYHHAYKQIYAQCTLGQSV